MPVRFFLILLWIGLGTLTAPQIAHAVGICEALLLRADSASPEELEELISTAYAEFIELALREGVTPDQLASLRESDSLFALPGGTASQTQAIEDGLKSLELVFQLASDPARLEDRLRDLITEALSRRSEVEEQQRQDAEEVRILPYFQKSATIHTSNTGILAKKSTESELSSWNSLAAISPDGQWLATKESNGDLKISRSRDGSEAWKLSARTAAVAFSEDSRTIAVADWSGFVFAFDLATQKELLAEATDQDGEPTSLLFTPEGQLVLSSKSNRTGHYLTRMWDMAAPNASSRSLSLHGGAVIFSRLGKALLSNYMMKLYGTSLNGPEDVQFQIPGDLQFFSPDGNHVLTGDNRLTLCWIDARTRAARRTEVLLPAGSTPLFTLPGGAPVMAAFDWRKGKVHLYGLGSSSMHRESPKLYPAIDKPAWAASDYSAALSPDGKHLAVATPARRIDIWDTQTWEKSQALSVARQPKRLEFSRDGKKLFAHSNPTHSSGEILVLSLKQASRPN